MTKKTLGLLAICLIISDAAWAAPTTRSGVGLFYGRNIRGNSVTILPLHVAKDHEWSYLTLYPYFSWRWDRVSVSLEGDIGKYNFRGDRDSLLLGVSLLGSYDIVQKESFQLYVEAGPGTAWWSDTPSRDLVDGYLPALFQYGGGIRIPCKERTYRIGYRIHHASFLGREDCGVNTHGIIVGIEF